MASVAMTCLWLLVNIMMTFMEALDKAIREALDRMPCSDRQLALTAGISAAMVSRIRSGERRASIQTAYRIANALRSWSDDCEAAERVVRRAISKAEANRK